jgi:hypothetical protein
VGSVCLKEMTSCLVLVRSDKIEYGTSHYCNHTIANEYCYDVTQKINSHRGIWDGPHILSN